MLLVQEDLRHRGDGLARLGGEIVLGEPGDVDVHIAEHEVIALLGQLLGNLLGGGWNGWGANPATAAAMAAGCSENMPVTRYDLDREQKLAAKDAEIAMLKANTYNDQKSLEMYAYIDGQLKDIRKSICDQAVHNQRTEDSFVLARQDIASVKDELHREIEMEAERRCCGDNSIVTYANATFYPKQVADVTTGTATTAQTLYNPLPKCGCCNK